MADSNWSLILWWVGRTLICFLYQINTHTHIHSSHDAFTEITSVFQCQVVRSRSNSCLETWTARWQEESLCLSSSCSSLRFCFCYFGPSIGDACRTLRITPPSPSENIPTWYEVKLLTHLRSCLNFTHQPDRDHEGLMWCNKALCGNNSSSTHPPFMVVVVLEPMTAVSLTRFIKPQVRNLWIVFYFKFHEEINAVFILLNHLKGEAFYSVSAASHIQTAVSEVCSAHRFRW